MTKPPLSTAEIEATLNEVLVWALSTHRSATPLAAALAPFTRAEQDFVLRWADAIAKTNAEMAYQFTSQAPTSMQLMSLDGVEAWAVRAMDVYDKMGLYPACTVFREVAAFAAEAAEKAHGIGFEEIRGVLELFVRGLSGRPLKLELGDETYTDTATLFLPPHLTRFPDRDGNYRLYKAMVAHQWAQTRYGTFATPLTETFAGYPDPQRAERVFHGLETVRLDARLARDLAGLHREMAALRTTLDEGGWPAAWQPYLARLQDAHASVHDTLALLAELYGHDLPAAVCYQGLLHADRAEAAMAARVAREQEQFRTALLELLGEKDGEYAQAPEKLSDRFSLSRTENPDLPGEFSFSLSLDGKPIPPRPPP